MYVEPGTKLRLWNEFDVTVTKVDVMIDVEHNCTRSCVWFTYDDNGELGALGAGCLLAVAKQGNVEWRRSE